MAKETTNPSLKERNRPSTTEKAWEKLLSFLKKKKARVTRSRRIVFDLVMSRHDHFRADEIAEELSRSADRASRGTVYRTLALMVDAGLVQTVRDSDKHFHYEHVFGHQHHEHMICDVCGAFIEFRAPEIAKAIEKRCKEYGFGEHLHRLSVFGVCKDCREKN